MASEHSPTPAVQNWLTSNDWHPGRDIGERADELIQIRVQDAERHEVPLPPTPAAVRAIHAYGWLTLSHPTVQRSAWIMDPTFGYDGDVKAIHELSLGLGFGLFPVGYESSECGIILVDENSRFFHLHHTGGYYLGENDFDAFSRFLGGVVAPDAEDFFV